MSRRNPPLLEYNSKNLERVVKSIWKNLSPELLPIKKYQIKNAVNPMFGHCHTASCCLYKIFGSENLHTYRAKDNTGMFHWWVKDKNHFILDLTWTQFSAAEVMSIYKKGDKASMQGFVFRHKVNELLDLVRKDLKFLKWKQ